MKQTITSLVTSHGSPADSCPLTPPKQPDTLPPLTPQCKHRRQNMMAHLIKPLTTLAVRHTCYLAPSSGGVVATQWDPQGSVSLTSLTPLWIPCVPWQGGSQGQKLSNTHHGLCFGCLTGPSDSRARGQNTPQTIGEPSPSAAAAHQQQGRHQQEQPRPQHQ